MRVRIHTDDAVPRRPHNLQALVDEGDVAATPGGDAPQSANRLARRRVGINTAHSVVSKYAAGGHIMMKTDNITWCRLCGHYCTLNGRFAALLNRDCPLVPPKGQKSLYRLLKSRHPITNEPLSTGTKRLAVNDALEVVEDSCEEFWQDCESELLWDNIWRDDAAVTNASDCTGSAGTNVADGAAIQVSRQAAAGLTGEPG